MTAQIADDRAAELKDNRDLPWIRQVVDAERPCVPEIPAEQALLTTEKPPGRLETCRPGLGDAQPNHNRAKPDNHEKLHENDRKRQT